MSFASGALVLNALLGGAAAAVSWRVSRGRLTWRSVRIALIFVTAGLAAAVLAGHLAGWVDPFGVIHIAYRAATVAMPAAAALLVILGRHHAVPRSLRSALLIVAMLPPAVGVYATHVEPLWLRVDEVAIDIDGSHALIIGVLADLQTPDVGDHERGAVERLLGASVDLVLVPGDVYQTGSGPPVDDARGRFQELFADLASRVPVFVVEGDADRYEDLVEMLAPTGAVVLGDEVRTVELRGSVVAVAGLRTRTSAAARSEVLSSLADAPDDAIRIVLAHRPDVVFVAGAASPDLVVAGHTHGGQVAIPWFGPPFLLSDVPRRVGAGGLHNVEGIDMFVSTGVGLERGQAPPVRFLVRPSVGLIDVS